MLFLHALGSAWMLYTVASVTGISGFLIGGWAMSTKMNRVFWQHVTKITQAD